MKNYEKITTFLDEEDLKFIIAEYYANNQITITDIHFRENDYNCIETTIHGMKKEKKEKAKE